MRFSLEKAWNPWPQSSGHLETGGTRLHEGLVEFVSDGLDELQKFCAQGLRAPGQLPAFGKRTLETRPDCLKAPLIDSVNPISIECIPSLSIPFNYWEDQKWGETLIHRALRDPTKKDEFARFLVPSLPELFWCEVTNYRLHIENGLPRDRLPRRAHQRCLTDSSVQLAIVKADAEKRLSIRGYIQGTVLLIILSQGMPISCWRRFREINACCAECTMHT